MTAGTLRLFVAVYPPPDAVAAMLAALELLALPAPGRVAQAQIHMTLQFIGDTPERDLEEVQESIARAASGIPAFDLHPIRLVTLPEGPRPRLVAAETDAPPGLLEVQRRLAHRLARKVHGRQHERFRPHLTLQRFKSRADRIDRSLEIAPFRVGEVHLMRSVLRSAGAEHICIFRVALD
jgi:RNA 2',3'-cyclic 3'-phosphodiesterase